MFSFKIVCLLSFIRNECLPQGSEDILDYLLEAVVFLFHIHICNASEIDFCV